MPVVLLCHGHAHKVNEEDDILKHRISTPAAVTNLGAVTLIPIVLLCHGHAYKVNELKEEDDILNHR
jgi:hypothetical protein